MLSRLVALIESLPARFEAWLAKRYTGYDGQFGDAYEAMDRETEAASREGRERKF